MLKKNFFLCVFVFAFFIILCVFFLVILFSFKRIKSFSSSIFLSSHFVLLLLQKCYFFSFNTSIKSHTMCQIFLKPQRQIIIVNRPFICGSFFKDFFPLITRIQSIIDKYPIPTIQSILQQIDLLWFFFLFSFNLFFSVASPVH